MMFAGEKLEVDVPPGTLNAETQFTYQPQSGCSQPTGALGYAGISFQLTAHTTGSGESVTTFDPPLQVTIHYDLALLGDVTEDSLRLYFWDTDSTTWRDVVTTCAGGAYVWDLDAHWFRVPLCHLSEFAVLGQRLQAGNGFSIFLPLVTK